MQPFRKAIPSRTCMKKYKNYGSYKPYLREDFNERCGYCDVLDKRYGGRRVFHIDHFRPQKCFPDLKNDYNNLVYACPYCNGGKRDDWPAGIGEHSVVDGKGYVDPCDRDFDNHFARYDDGRICPQTDVGNYMFQKLKLGLRRHRLAWMYEQLEDTLNNLWSTSILCREITEFASKTALLSTKK